VMTKPLPGQQSRRQQTSTTPMCRVRDGLPRQLYSTCTSTPCRALYSLHRHTLFESTWKQSRPLPLRTVPDTSAMLPPSRTCSEHSSHLNPRSPHLKTLNQHCDRNPCFFSHRTTPTLAKRRFSANGRAMYNRLRRLRRSSNEA